MEFIFYTLLIIFYIIPALLCIIGVLEDTNENHPIDEFRISDIFWLVACVVLVLTISLVPVANLAVSSRWHEEGYLQFMNKLNLTLWKRK